MKLFTKRALVLALALAVILGCAACGTSPAPAGSSSAPAASGGSAPAASTDPGDGRAMEGNLYLEGLPIVKEKESFSILIDTDANPADMAILQDIEAATNVSIEWQAYATDIATEKMNLMYSSGEYPDVVSGWLLKDEHINKYGLNDDVFIPVDALYDSYAPRINYVLDNFPGARSAVTAPDGHIYTAPLISPQPATRFVMHINKTWLEKVGMPMPTSTDELYEVLKAFKTQDPNGNGKADEIPFSTVGTNIGRIYGWFGLPDETIHFQRDPSTGEPVFTGNTEGWKNATKYFAKLFAEGLLDPEVFTHDNAQYQAKGKTADALYGVYEDWGGPNTVGLERYQEDYTALPVLKSPGVNNPTYRQGDVWIYRTQLAITSAAKNPATIVRWLDYLYEEDISVQVRMAKYGTIYERNADGSFTFIDPPAGETIDTLRYKHTLTNLAYGIMPEVNALFPKSAEELNKDAIDELYAPNIVPFKMPVYWLTAEESESISTIQADIDRYLKDRRAAWITGQADIDAEWDSYQAQLKTLGLDQYIEVFTTAINRSLAAG